MKTQLTVLLFTCLCFVYSCKQKEAEVNKEPSEELTEVQEETKTEPMAYIDPELDVLAIGKEYTNVLSDTLGIQLMEFTMKPGDSIGLHEHYDHTFYVLEGGNMMLYVNGTEAVELDLKPGMGQVSGPLKDAAKNVGNTTIKLLITEVHRPRE
ncbi:cupin domain-containing protein [Aestuariivivens sediminicola]|uniref:cupin domain-containing protein n=2 Tax=Aestuariivivens sediminicola TaxID=2913560 RepID=UPI001F56E3B7|nr:cupin domain-containing protein [Aestuariivivens sediminicola]